MVFRKNATSSLNLWGKACLVAEFSNAVSELVVSGYYITPKTASDVLGIHVVMTTWGQGYHQVSKEGQATILGQPVLHQDINSRPIFCEGCNLSHARA